MTTGSTNPLQLLDELHGIAAGLELRLDESEFEAYAAVVAKRLDAYARLDDLASATEPQEHAQLGHAPSATENPHHAWVWRCDIRRRQDGPLAGLTVAVKDNICLAGTPTRFGSRLMKSYVARANAPIVDRVLDAGALIIGKTAMTDLGNDGAGVTGYPEPRPDNPWKRGHLAGGSSSGSAVAVAAGEVNLALGNDAGGSIREPASWSGCCGLKPTHGLVPAAGGLPFEPRLVDAGPLASTVAECALLLSVISDGRTDYQAGLGARLDGLVIGVLAEGFGIPLRSHADVDDSVREAILLLRSLGATLRNVSVPSHSDAIPIWTAIGVEGTTDILFNNTVAKGPMGHFADAVRQRPLELPPTSIASFLLGEYILRKASRRRSALAHELGNRLRADYDQALAECDVLVMPTTPAKSQRQPPRESDLETFLDLAAGSYENTAPFNVTGHPALSIPCGFQDELPIGLMIVGRHMEDHLVLQIGHAFQEARGLPTIAAAT